MVQPASEHVPVCVVQSDQICLVSWWFGFNDLNLILLKYKLFLTQWSLFEVVHVLRSI